MTATLIGYTCCSTDKQDLATQKAALEQLGVAADRIYTDHGLTGTNRSPPGLNQVLTAIRTGDPLACGIAHPGLRMRYKITASFPGFRGLMV